MYDNLPSYQGPPSPEDTTNTPTVLSIFSVPKARTIGNIHFSSWRNIPRAPHEAQVPPSKVDYLCIGFVVRLATVDFGAKPLARL